MDMIHKDLERKNAQIAAFKQDIEQERDGSRESENVDHSGRTG